MCMCNLHDMLMLRVLHACMCVSFMVQQGCLGCCIMLSTLPLTLHSKAAQQSPARHQPRYWLHLCPLLATQSFMRVDIWYMFVLQASPGWRCGWWRRPVTWASNHAVLPPFLFLYYTPLVLSLSGLLSSLCGETALIAS